MSHWLVLGALLAVGYGGSSLTAQQNYPRTVADGLTPPGVEGGAPAGSFPLSGFETVNEFNGNLNVALPLVSIGGRGEAGYTITLKIEHSFSIQSEDTCEPGLGPCVSHDVQTLPWTAKIPVDYEPGLMVGRTGVHVIVADDENVPSCPGSTEERFRLTRFTFTMPDGSDVQFRDIATEGEHDENVNAPSCGAPGPLKDRGRVFMAYDGSGAVFALDQGYQENFDLSAVPTTAEMAPSGNLMFRSGVLYRIERGLVRWMRDRNGNVTRLYRENDGIPPGQQTPEPTRRVVRVVDSIGREVYICYAGETCAYDSSQTAADRDRIIYFGTSGNLRQLWSSTQTSKPCCAATAARLHSCALVPV